MIQRLLEKHYAQNRSHPTHESVDFWMAELRTPELLRELISGYPERAALASLQRPALHEPLEESLRAEEDRERRADREYWRPLREELEQLRLKKKSPSAQA